MVSHKINTSRMPLTVNAVLPFHDKILCVGYSIGQKCTAIYFTLCN